MKENTNIECIEDVDLYKMILKRIDAIASSKGHKSGYLAMSSLGLGTKLYYTMQKFIKGEKLDNGMARPLKENKLNELCSKLNLKIIKPMYLVEF